MPKINLELLEKLSPEEKQAALEILKQISETGESAILDELKYADFDEIPVDIDTFLDDDDYLGQGLWERDPVTGERRCTLFPYWRNTLKKLFPTNLTTAYNTLILTGAIGLGKTLMGCLAMLYLLYRMLCLKDPYAYYGMMPSDKITFSMLNITLETAQGVGWDKIQQLVQASPWFMNHGAVNASRTNPQWQPDKHIELIFGSNNNHIVGRALFANLTDEVNFGIGSDVEKKKAKQKKMIAQIDARMRSRFLKGTFLPTLNIIISSKDTEQAFLNTYIETKRKNESKTALIIDEPQWVVRPDKGTPDDPGAFYVAIGGKTLAHELLPVGATESLLDAMRAKGYQLLKVPPGFREAFEDNLDQALMDIAGYSVSSATKYISGVRLNQAKIDTYQNPFNKDVIEVGDGPEDVMQYANFFDISKVDPRDMARPMFIHLDMSTGGKGKGDKTGIAGVVITGKNQTVNGEDSSREMQYKLIFSVSVKAPRGFNISFAKNKNFIRWLRDKGFAIKGISSDTFQSASVLQELAADGFRTEIISVDRVDPKSHMCLPYAFLKSSIYEGRIQIYQKCDQLTDELIGLERKGDGHIDHTAEGINSKDQADAVCGALYLASKFGDEYAYNYGENLDASLNVSMQNNQEKTKKQMMLDYQEELQKLYMETYEELNRPIEHTEEEQEEYKRYQDIMDGIIII